MTQIQAYEDMSKEALIEHHLHTLQQHADDMDMLSKELASRKCTAPQGQAIVDALNDLLGAAHPAYIQDEHFRNKLIKARDKAFKALEKNRLDQKGKVGDSPMPTHPELLPSDIRVGRLPTMNQDEYPGLGDWWVQLRIGPEFDEVLARVYGDSPQQAVERAQALASAAAPVDTSATCTCPSGDGSLRWPCPVHPPC